MELEPQDEWKTEPSEKRKKDPVKSAHGKLGAKYGKLGAEYGKLGGRPSNKAREFARAILSERLIIADELLQRFSAKDGTVKGMEAIKALELLYKMSGLDVQKHASTDADGNDLPAKLDTEALDALIEARRQELSN